MRTAAETTPGAATQQPPRLSCMEMPNLRCFSARFVRPLPNLRRCHSVLVRCAFRICRSDPARPQVGGSGQTPKVPRNACKCPRAPLCSTLSSLRNRRGATRRAFGRCVCACKSDSATAALDGSAPLDPPHWLPCVASWRLPPLRPFLPHGVYKPKLLARHRTS